ncbi:Rv1733c family protein [Streptomyces sp. NBC_00024]|uniref:Rv1733c family protein n=1 Tax=Streptomyces sp. NBC_00024 TaxID=2903612 RepID=UPI0032462BD1
MNAKAWLWRWRANPLRRRSDVVEARVVLVAVALMAVGAPVAGATTAWSVDDSLQQQRQERHPTSGLLIKDAPYLAGYTGQGTVRAAVRWTSPDGSVRTGTAPVEPGSKAGTPATIWLDTRGRLTGQPPTAVMAEVEADLAGALAAAGVGAVLLAGRGIAAVRLNRSRDAQWDREWSVVGPQWSRRRA